MEEEKPTSPSISTLKRECIMEEQRVSKEARQEGAMPSIIDEIMKDLTQPNISVFGVYGSNVMRKVSVVWQINKRVEREGLFDAVVMASVIRNPRMKSIQVELGYELGLRLKEITTPKERAACLCHKIKIHEKILIILGNLDDEINLSEMGIPFGNDHMGCKILLLASTKEVLSHKMKTQTEHCVDNEAGEFCLPCGNDMNDTGAVLRLFLPKLWGGGSGGIEVLSEAMNSKLDEMINALTKQPKISIVGMYGSSNKIKIAAVEQIKRIGERDWFDVVVKASVVNKNTRWCYSSKSPDVGRIQGELANQLGLQLYDKTSLEERATLLCDTIKTIEMILIFLVDLQGPIDLDQIGIPFGNDHMGSKIVLVARTPEILSKQMNPPQTQFSVDD